MSLTLITGDIHCGQDYSSYKPTQKERLKKANYCIAALSNFQADHRHEIGQVVLVGDVLQITGQRAVSQELDMKQLKMLGVGMQQHNAQIVYVAGSADPCYDPMVTNVEEGEFHENTAKLLAIDQERLHLPGLIHQERDDKDTLQYIATHGHMNEFINDVDAYTTYLLNPRQAHDKFTSEKMLAIQRKSENMHQFKGMVYEFAYRWVIRRSKWLSKTMDNTMKQEGFKEMPNGIKANNLPDDTVVFQGHNHVPAVLCNDKGTVIANPGSLTGSFRMDPQEPGTFMTVEDIKNTTGRIFTLWEINALGEYNETSTTMKSVV